MALSAGRPGTRAKTPNSTSKRYAAFLGAICREKFGRLRHVPKTGLSAELLGQWRTRMNLLWIRPASAEQSLQPDERRVRDYMDSPGGVSESASSLADKMGISRRRCRGILEQLVQQGIVQRRDFADIEPMYLRFPSR
jgi:hypothetical protein